MNGRWGTDNILWMPVLAMVMGIVGIVMCCMAL